MNARDAMIAAIDGFLVHQGLTHLDDDLAGLEEDIHDALRAAAGAGPGDTITIGPDGDVGRLTPHGAWLTKRNPDGSLHCNHSDRDHCTAADHETELTYRVVTP